MSESNNLLNREVIESTVNDMPKNIAYCILSNVAGFFWSRPGAGKSKTFEEVAKALGYHLVDLRLSQIESIDLRGLPTKVYTHFELNEQDQIVGDDLEKSLEMSKEATVAWAMPDFLVSARKAREKYGKNTIFLFDELNHADETNQAAAYQFILEKKIGCFSLHEDDRVFAAGNFEGEGSIANPMSLALANRMNHYYVKPDVVSWCRWARLNNLNPIVIAYAEKNPAIFNEYPDEDGAGKDKGWLTPRTLENCSKFYNTIVNEQEKIHQMFHTESDFDMQKEEYSELYDLIKKSVVNNNQDDIFEDLEVNLAGAIGLSSSTALMSYIRVGHELPDPKKILDGTTTEFDFEIDKDRVDVQCVASNQCISAILYEFTELKKIHAKHGFSKISSKSNVPELEDAKADFYKKYENLVLFCYNNFNPDLFTLTVVTKIIREFDILPWPQLISKETFGIIRDALNGVLSKNF